MITAPKSLPIELNEGSGIGQGFVKELALNTTEPDLIPNSTCEFSQACSEMIPEQSLDVTHNTLLLLPHNKGRTKFGRKREPRDVVEGHRYSGWVWLSHIVLLEHEQYCTWYIIITVACTLPLRSLTT